jgi:hypothetical protein
MPEAQEGVLHDVTALIAFINSVSVTCVNRDPAAAYTAAADRFFLFISELADKSVRYLSSWRPIDNADFEDRRSELQSIRAVWRHFHNFIKPTLDADTLHGPYSVLAGIIQRTRELPGLEGLDVAMFLTPEPNHIQVYVTSFHENALKIRALVPNAPLFPTNLALIGVPYSQDSTTFPNCLIAHELGHHIGNQKDLRTRLDEAANASIRAYFGAKYANADAVQRSVWIKTVGGWAEEIFCDLFGVLLLGPCFAYSYIEHFDLCSVLDSSGTISGDRLGEATRFYVGHPSHHFRVQQQAQILRASNWWEAVTSTGSHVSDLLRQSLEIDLAVYVSKDELGDLVHALIDILPQVRAEVGAVFNGADDGWNEYSQLATPVKSYLKYGVVPSSVVSVERTENQDALVVHPSPLVLLNAGMEFYLTEVGTLMRTVPKEDPSSCERRVHWVRRIEQWISKAIEDHLLMGGSA